MVPLAAACRPRLAGLGTEQRLAFLLQEQTARALSALPRVREPVSVCVWGGISINPDDM